MALHYILSVISDDKPGIVKAIAELVAGHGGSWLESRLAELDGKFAGVIRISVEEAQSQPLQDALVSLKSKGIVIQAEPLSCVRQEESPHLASFSLVGPDRTGIVRELAHAFAQYNINVEELSTHCSSMPYSGEPLFEAEGVIKLPKEGGLEPLMEHLDAIASELGLDIHLEENPAN